MFINLSAFQKTAVEPLTFVHVWILGLADSPDRKWVDFLIVTARKLSIKTWSCNTGVSTGKAHYSHH